MAELESKPIEKSAISVVVGEDAEYFTKDVSHLPNYQKFDGSDLRLLQTGTIESWGGNGPDDFESFRQVGSITTEEDNATCNLLSLHGGEINVFHTIHADGSQTVETDLKNPIKSILQRHGSAINAWKASGYDILKIRNGVYRKVEINPQGQKTADKTHFKMQLT